ncbi:unnamed protein product [Rhizophagus irregularis]|nr:unnamed protein product [Rhizophagus irregularis]
MDYPNKIIYFNNHCENCDKISTNKQDNERHKWCKSCQINYLRENFINWTSGNKNIDNFIQEIQLKINHSWDTVFEWIPYSQFNEISQHDISDTKYSVIRKIWKDGPLYYNWNEKRYIRDSNKRVALKYLISNSQDEIKINEYIYKLKGNIINKFFKIYGISQNPDTKDYIMVLQIEYCEKVCIKCGKFYINKWCKSCQMNYLKENSVNWTSENKNIDNFIQEMQLKIENYEDIVFEWIPYVQFSNVKRKIGVNNSFILYSAKWKDGPLIYDRSIRRFKRNPNQEIAFKYYYNTQYIDQFLYEARENVNIQGYNNVFKTYGISQNPDTKDYIIIFQNRYCKNCYRVYTDIRDKLCSLCRKNYLRENFTNRTSENRKINSFIQKMRFRVFNSRDIEWIPYNQFIVTKVKVLEKYEFSAAKWKNGHLYKEIILKYFCNIQNIDEFLYETELYLTKNSNNNEKIYGISQNPHSKYYIMVFQNMHCKYCGEYSNHYRKLWWCKSCQINFLKENFENFTNWTSGNKKIDGFIQEMQLKINDFGDIILEWIPYNQFIDVKELGKQDFSTVYLAKWKDGPLKYNRNTERYERNLNEEFTLKCIYNSQNMIDEFLYKAEPYSIKADYSLKIYGISQNPDTDDYIVVQNKSYECCEICDNILTDIQSKWCKACQINNLRENFTNQISGNEEVDNFIQEMQLKVNNYDDIVVELISYNQFEGIEEVRRDDFSTICLAKWKDGPMYYDVDKKEYKRISNETVILKFLDNSQYEFLNKIQRIINKFDKFKINVLQIYGISQNPDTKDYIVVFQNERCTICGKTYHITYKWCKFCHIEKFISSSENKKIDDLIQEMRMKTHNPGTMVFEWIPYSEFDSIEKIDKGGFSVIYSAIWKIGPLSYDFDGMKYIREPRIKVALKCLNNSQNLTNEFLNEIEKYSTDTYSRYVLRTYGISQDPNTKDYIMVLEYAEGGNFNNWVNNNYGNFHWFRKLNILQNIINGLKEIHQKGLVHRDFHTGNILLMTSDFSNYDIPSISDMGLCGEVNNMDETKIYGVMPYAAPEVLRGKPYTRAADIYSFGMIMYFVATGKQPFANRAHDKLLALDIVHKEIRPEINESEIPKCYIDLMKECWDPNPINRPSATEIDELISSFRNNFIAGKSEKFKELEISIENNKSATHSQAIYTSRLLNPFTKDLNTECLDCAIVD